MYAVRFSMYVVAMLGVMYANVHGRIDAAFLAVSISIAASLTFTDKR